MDAIGGIGEVALRLGAFLAVFAFMASLELVSPRRVLRVNRWRRWTTNLAIIALDNLVVRAMAALSVPLVAVAAAAFAEEQGWGLMNQLTWPAVLEGALAVIALDFALWLQHVASHRIPLFWRLHQMHHADPDIDVTTGIRFHPIEIALSMLWKIIWVLALGASTLAVIVFEIVLNAGAMWSHANVRIPLRLDRWIRTVVVTPDMHRIHHSTLRSEHDSNYGFNLSVWDHAFRTYSAEPADGHEGMNIGLAAYRSEAPARLGWSLALPFRPLRKDGEGT